MSMRPGDEGPQDEIDRLFARLTPVKPPAELSSRILAALPKIAPVPISVPRKRRISAQAWRWISVIAAILLIVMSLRLGTQLEESGALNVLGDAFGDLGSFMSAPGDYLSALFSAIPWFDLIVTLLALAVFWIGSSTLVDDTRSPARR